MKKIIYILSFFVIAGIAWLVYSNTFRQTPVPMPNAGINTSSTADNTATGDQNTGDNPQIYLNQNVVINYTNASSDMIKVELPLPGSATTKQFTVMGQARGSWFFEGSFPVQILDKEGKSIFQTPASAQGEWMTENFVPFRADITIPGTYTGPATVLLKNDNPSGDPSMDRSISFPITIQ